METVAILPEPRASLPLDPHFPEKLAISVFQGLLSKRPAFAKLNKFPMVI
jgi:hypothetical protein